MPQHDPNAKPDPTEIRFIFEKSRFFRVIHVDGAHGSISPNGRSLVMSLFSERRTIPREQVFGIKGEALESEPKFVDDRNALFREVEVCAIIDMNVARAIHTWLGKQIEIHEKLSEIIKNKTMKNPIPTVDREDE